MCYRQDPRLMKQIELDEVKQFSGYIGGFALLWADHVYDPSIHQHEGLAPERIGGYCMTIADTVKCQAKYRVTTSGLIKTLSWYPVAANGISKNENIVMSTILEWFTMFGKQMFNCSSIGDIKVLPVLQPWSGNIFAGVKCVENRASRRAICISPFRILINGCKVCLVAGLVGKCACVKA